MYETKYYPKGIWTNIAFESIKIPDMSLAYLWNAVFHITEGLTTHRGKSRKFWKNKRRELLDEIDHRALKGKMLPIHVKSPKGKADRT